MDKTENEGTNMITVRAICKRCGETFEKKLPKCFLDACEQAGAEGFKSTCPKCAAADPIYKALHPMF
jgi:hypothetical protein